MLAARLRRPHVRRAVNPWLERLEPREVPATLLDPLLQPKFVTPLPNPLSPDFVFRPTTPGGTTYQIGAAQTQQPLGLIDPVTKQPLITTVWGYGNAAQPATYPGRTFEVQANTPITVQWANNLVDATGKPLPHLLPIDTSIHWAFTGQGPNGASYPADGVPIVTHLHGGHTAASSDGLPDAWFTPNYAKTGPLFNQVYTYGNTQQAGTLWYHDHALGITRLNVYAGLAGFYLVRDTIDTGKPNNPAGLPANEYKDINSDGKLDFLGYEIPLVIQDRMFDSAGQLYYPSAPPVAGAPNPSVLPEFFGDFILVNGKTWPVLDVEPRAYRFRVLNGSDSRFYNLSLAFANNSTGARVYQVGTDDGLLAKPVELKTLTLAPGERADLIIDFSGLAGQTVVLKNDAKTPYPAGTTVDPKTTGQIMAFRVGTKVNVAYRFDPTRPLRAPITPLTPDAPTRQLVLMEGTDKYGRITPMLGTLADGSLMWNDPLTERIRLGSTEVWEIYNGTVDAHPIHLHQVSFQVLSRQKFKATVVPTMTMDGGVGGKLTKIKLIDGARGPAANEAGWKDTVQMMPGEVTRIIARFDLLGKYVWHCHILSHEDNEMMRPFEVIAAPGKTAALTPMTTMTTTVDATAVTAASQLTVATPATGTSGQSTLYLAAPTGSAGGQLTVDPALVPLVLDPAAQDAAGSSGKGGSRQGATWRERLLAFLSRFPLEVGAIDPEQPS